MVGGGANLETVINSDNWKSLIQVEKVQQK